MHYFSIFLERKLTNYALIFCALGRKTQVIGNFEKIFKSFLNKIAKNALFAFFEKFYKPCVSLLRVWTKNANYWKF